MWRIVRWLFTGQLEPVRPSVKALRARLEDLEERVDYLTAQLKRLRGHVTGSLRYDRSDDGETPEGVPEDFPENEFQRLLEEKRRHG